MVLRMLFCVIKLVDRLSQGVEEDLGGGYNLPSNNYLAS